ncbi:MAG: hypothetical protein JNM13_06500 [Hyphomicrobiaceae bacterium]|nr:hypothetical protein [Hyphomicrobiaceae bacterium]
MTRDQFMAKLRKYARKRRIRLNIDEVKGKGSHYGVELEIGDRLLRSTIQHGELSPFHVNRICKQLEIDPVDLGS